MGAPVEMTVSRKDSDGLNNVRSNLVVATRSVSAARAVNVLKRGNFKPAGDSYTGVIKTLTSHRNTIINGNCVDILPQLPASSINFALTDRRTSPVTNRATAAACPMTTTTPG